MFGRQATINQPPAGQQGLAVEKVGPASGVGLQRVVPVCVFQNGVRLAANSS
jgi:hypothetical protein